MSTARAGRQSVVGRFAAAVARPCAIAALGLLLAGSASAGVSSVTVGDASATVTNGVGTTINFPVTRSGDSSYAMSVTYTTANSSAVAGTDFASTTGFITIPAGSLSGLISVPIIGHLGTATSKAFTLNLLGAAGVPAAQFADAGTFNFGGPAGMLQAADFNSDGKPDFAYINGESGTLAVVFNTTAPGAGTASFSPAVTIPLDLPFPLVTSLGVGDFNGDGKPDVVVTGFASGDGGGPGTISVFLNTTPAGASVPSFSSPVTLFTQFPPAPVAVADFNGDGKPDLAYVDGLSFTAFILVNTTPIGTFQPSFIPGGTKEMGVPNFIFPDSVTTADVNDDGKPDLVVGNAPNSYYALLNTTQPGTVTPVFTGPVQFAGGGGKQVVADINGDGKPDMAAPVLPQYLQPNFSISLNSTNPGSYVPIFSHLPQFIAANHRFDNLTAADFNGDGKPDFATGSDVLLNGTVPGAAVAAFSPIAGYPAAGSAVPDPLNTVIAGDFNADGKPDLAVLEPSAQVSMQFNSTPAPATAFSLHAHADFTVGLQPSAGAVADFNGDGKPDLVVVNGGSNTVSILTSVAAPGNASPSYATPVPTYYAGTDPQAVAVGDFNGDGKPDIAIASTGDNAISILLNTSVPGASTPSFADPVSLPVGTAPMALAAGDLNGDGLADLVVGYRNGTAVSVLLNLTPPGAATPVIAPRQDFAVPSAGCGLAIGDINNDGRPDVAVCSSADNSAALLINSTVPGSATASFAVYSGFTVGAGPSAIAIKDVNGDNWPDLVVTDKAANRVSILLNTTTAGAAAPSLAPHQDFLTGISPTAVAVADLDGNGMPDLAVTNAGANTVSILFNKTPPGAAAANFAAHQDFATGTAPAGIDLSDLNGDGKSDLAVVNQSGNSVSVLLNTQYGVIVARNKATGTIQYATVIPAAPSGLSAVAAPGSVQLQWSGSPGAATYNVYQGTKPGAESATPVLTGITATQVMINGLTNGTIYYFTVTAVDTAGQSPPSNEASAMPVTAPPAPSGLTAKPGDMEVSLNWNATPWATRYRVYVNGQFVGDTTATSYVATGLQDGTAYGFSVSGINAQGEGPKSAAILATPLVLPLPPPAPTGIVVSSGDGTAELNWTASPGATSYRIYQGLTPGGESKVPVQTGITSPYASLSGLVNGITYYLTITAVNASGESPASQEAIAIPQPFPTIPTGVIAVGGFNQATVSWNSVPGASAYSVSYGSGFFESTIFGITGTSVTITGLQSGTWNFSVTADQGQLAGDPSPYVSAIVRDPFSLATISPTAVTAGGPGFMLSLTGTGYTKTSTVYFNGLPRPTTLVSNTQLTASIPATDIATPCTVWIFVADSPPPALKYTNGLFFGINPAGQGVTVNQAPLPANDAVWDAVNQRIYLSVPNLLSPDGNAVAAVDPMIDSVIRSTATGSVPNILAATGDGSYLYAGLDANNAVQRFTLPALGTDVRLDLGSEVAQSIEVAPGFPHTVAVAPTYGESADPSVGVMVFDDSKRRPVIASASGNFVQWGTSSSTLYTSRGDTLLVTASGLALQNQCVPENGQLDHSFHFDTTTKLIYTENGLVIDPANCSLVGTFSAAQLLVPDSTLNRAFIVGQTVLQQDTANYTVESLDLTHFTPIAQITLDNLAGNPKKMIRWGANGLALVMNTGVTYLLSGPFVDGNIGVPLPPATLAATAGNAAATLSWSAVPNAASYKIYGGLTSNGEGAVPNRSNITSTSGIIAGLKNGTTYFFKVTAVNASGESVGSSEASVTPGPPLAPTNVTATPGNGRVTLNWTASANTSSYYIYQSGSSGGEASPAVLVVSGGSSTSAVVSGLTNGRAYYFEIKAVNPVGGSPYSNEASVIPGPPPAPTNLAATASGTGTGKVSLNWTASASASSYYIYKSLTASGEAPPAVLVVPGGSSTSATVTGLVSGTQYFFEIKALNSVASSPFSNEASATPN